MEASHAGLNTKLKRHVYFYLHDRCPCERQRIRRSAAAVAQAGAIEERSPLLWSACAGLSVRVDGSGFADMEEFSRRVLDDLWSGLAWRGDNLQYRPCEQ